MHGTKHCNDFEDACSKLEDYVSSLAQQIQIQKDVQERLVQSEVYYEHQYGEAKIVANVSLTPRAYQIGCGGNSASGVMWVIRLNFKF